MSLSAKLRWMRFWYPVSRVFWALWSHVYRATHHRKYRSIKLESGLTPMQCADRVTQLTWTKDALPELWDAIGHPGWPQFCLNALDRGEDQPEGALDCDDSTAWCQEAMDPEYGPYTWCLGWALASGETQGHAMCGGVHPSSGDHFHVGNWGYMGPYPSFDAMVRATLKRAKATQIVSWAILGRDLFPEKTGFDYPGEEE